MGCTGKQRKIILKDGESLGDERGLHFRANSTKVGALRPAWTLKNTGSGSGYGKMGSGGALSSLVAFSISGTSRVIDLSVSAVCFACADTPIAPTGHRNRDEGPGRLMGGLSDWLKGGRSQSAKPEMLINSSRKDASSNLT